MEDVLEDVRARLARFADVEAEPAGAPLYAAFARVAAADDDLARLLAVAPPAQRRGTLFFAAFHHLVAASPGGWPTIAAASDPSTAFRAFCLDHADEMRARIATRRTQTNEVGRSAALLPALASLGGPIALIEPGASGGLNLNLDRSRYSYGTPGGDAATVGASTCVVSCEARGAVAVPVPLTLPTIASRIGVDLDPIDLHDPDAVSWLRACVWTEHPARAAMLDRAIEIARAHPVTVLRGDALDLLPSVIEGAPDDATACVFHCTFLPYLDAEQTSRFVEILREASARREIVWIGYEGWGAARAFGLEGPARAVGENYSMLLTRVRLRDGAAVSTEALAYGAPHGGWIRWLA